jgi:hypothetical protein
MATIDISWRHGTTLDEARDKTRDLVEAVRIERPNLVRDVRWDGDGARATGKGFDGRFRVSATHVTIAVDLALLARPFKSKVEHTLRDRLTAAFGAGG